MTSICFLVRGLSRVLFTAFFLSFIFCLSDMIFNVCLLCGPSHPFLSSIWERLFSNEVLSSNTDFICVHFEVLAILWLFVAIRVTRSIFEVIIWISVLLDSLYLLYVGSHLLYVILEVRNDELCVDHGYK